MVKRSTWSPICCTVGAPTELLQTILTKSYDFPISSGPVMVLITSLSERYTSPTLLPLPSSLPPLIPALFQNMSPVQCSKALKTFIDLSDSDLNYEFFAIVDERTVRDSTLLLCVGDTENLKTIRAEAQIANVQLAAWSVASGGINEGQEIVEAQMEKGGDDVLRMEIKSQADQKRGGHAPRKRLG